MHNININFKPKAVSILLFTLSFFVCVNSQTIHVGGSYNGNTIWNADTVKVDSNVFADNLTISPGTVVQFQSNYSISVDDLIATGTANDTILFTISDTTGFHDFESETGGWKGIRINYSVIMKYCKIEYGKNLSETNDIISHTAILDYINYECQEFDVSHILFTNNYTNHTAIAKAGSGVVDKVTLDNCSFINNYSNALRLVICGAVTNSRFINNNGNAVVVYEDDFSVKIMNCTMTGNKGYGIRCEYELKRIDIIGNYIFGNNGGVHVFNVYGPLEMTDNIIMANKLYGGVYLGIQYMTCHIVNNVICFNENVETEYAGGLTISEEYSPYYKVELINNTICYNSSENGGGVNIHSSNPEFYNNIIRGNKASGKGNQIFMDADYPFPSPWSSSFYNCNIEGGLEDMYYRRFGGIYENNIDIDPYFTDTAKMDFSLTDSSYCINAATKDVTDLPEKDVAGNCRIYGTLDIGAYEYQGMPVNRPPYFFTTFDTNSICKEGMYEFTIDYKDFDHDDEAHISISSSEEDIDIIMPTVDTSGSTYMLKPPDDWTGEAEITVRAEDLSGRYTEKCFMFYGGGSYCGVYSGTLHWTGDTVKIVYDVIAQELIIDPGTVVQFQGNYSITVDDLIAVGTITDTILFTINDTTGFHNFESETGGWERIMINKSVVMKYCKIEYAKNLTEENNFTSYSAILNFVSSELQKIELTNVSFIHNYTNHAAVIKLLDYSEGEIIIDSCSFIHNYSNVLKSMISITITNSCFMNNHGDAISAGSEKNLHVINCTIKGNKGYGIRTGELQSMEIIHNDISDNYGGIYVYGVEYGPLELIDNFIIANKLYGGVCIHFLFTYNKANRINRIVNNVICFNETDTTAFTRAGGITIVEDVSKLNTELINNTICYNLSQYGGGIQIFTWNPAFYNNIIRGNKATIAGNQIYMDPGMVGPEGPWRNSFYNCNIEGGLDEISCQNFEGVYENNIDIDPYFTDTANLDFSLTDSSLCINAATKDVTDLPETDLAGNPRIYCGTLDIGAYEYQGMPVNRPPYIFTTFDTVSILSHDTLKFTIDYKDFDYNDEAHISVNSSVPDIDIILPAVDTSGSTFMLKTADNWAGEAKITVKAEDLAGRYTEKSFILFVEKSYCGEYSGILHWTEDTVRVYCDIKADTLIIDPGVVVQFHGNYNITVNNLIATGTVTDTILFTINDTTGFHDFESEAGGWKGIRIGKSLDMKYCKIEYGKNLSEENKDNSPNAILNFVCSEYQKIEISNVLFTSNYTSQAEIVKAISYSNSDAVVDSSSFINNYSNVLRFEMGVTISNSSFINNKGDVITTYLESYYSVRVVNCTIKGNNGYGIHCGGDIMITEINHNYIFDNYGGLYLVPEHGPLELKDNIIIANKLYGGVFLNYLYNKTNYIINNVICFNENVTTRYPGGGITLGESSSASEIKLINNTICFNSSLYGGGIHMFTWDPSFYNNIIWGNKASVAGNQIYMNPELVDSTKPWLNSFYNCNIEGGLEDMSYPEFEGIYENNIDVDPYFTNTANMDFSLTDSSLCINTGKQDISGFEFPETDIAGNPRIAFDTVDIGAYEFVSQPLPYTVEDTLFNQCEGTSLSLIPSARFYDSVMWYKNNVAFSTEDTLKLVQLNPADEGYYLAGYYNNFGSANGDIITVIVNENPEVSLTATPYETGIPPVTVEPEVTYPIHEWSDGSTGNELTLDDSWGYATHTVWLNASDEQGCEGSDTIYITLVKPEGLWDTEYGDAITIVPNPFREKAKIYFPYEPEEDITLQLYNDLGQLVDELLINSIPFELKNDHYKKGMYTLVFKTNHTITVKKVVIH